MSKPAEPLHNSRLEHNHQSTSIANCFPYFLPEDVLTDAKGECVICLEELNPGDVIARLPCLCIYHKG